MAGTLVPLQHKIYVAYKKNDAVTTYVNSDITVKSAVQRWLQKRKLEVEYNFV
jgi:hypothetical protein